MKWMPVHVLSYQQRVILLHFNTALTVVGGREGLIIIVVTHVCNYWKTSHFINWRK